MEILVNGQAGLASTDNDVELGALFNYLRNEYAAQRLVIRRILLDGKELFLDEGGLELKDTPEKYKLCEIDIAPIEIVAVDVLSELEANVPQLAKKAVEITEHLQKSEFRQAREELTKFIESTHYVSQAIKTINELTGVDMAPAIESAELKDDISLLASHLAGVETALREEDFATVGDIMEFDVSPSVGTLVTLLKLLRVEVEAKIAEKFGADGSGEA